MSEMTAAGARAVAREWGFVTSGVAGPTGEVYIRTRRGIVETLHLPAELDTMSGKQRASLVERLARDYGEDVPDGN